MNTCYLIDGHALIFKMYYAFYGRPMVNSKGQDTSILFGFTKYLLELIEKEHPSHIAVSFDPPGGTFRNQLYPEYKANRGETPQLVIDALEPLTRILKAMDIPVLMIKGFEADDVIGSAAKRFAREGMDVYMVTPDKDYGQLVEEHIFQYRPGKSGADNEVLGVKEICEKWGIENTGQVIDILALCGDSSDNVPGVNGVGPVGASKLLLKYGSVETIYEHLSELTATQKAKFEAAAGHIGLSKTLVTIKTDIELDVKADDLLFNTVPGGPVSAIFDEYEFPSLKRLLVKVCADRVAVVPPVDSGLFSEYSGSGSRSVPVAFPEYTVVKSLPESGRVSLVLEGDRLFVSDGSRVTCGPVGAYRRLLEDAGVVKVGADLKLLARNLRAYGIELAGRLEDVELMHYVLNPERSHKLSDLTPAYLGVELVPQAETSELSLFDDEDAAATAESAERATEAGERAAVALYIIGMKLNASLDVADGQDSGISSLRRIYDTIEEPLVSVLERMEDAGVHIDVDSLNQFASSLRVQMAAKEAEVRELAGEPELNVASPKQIGTVLFEKLKLDPAARKPRNGNWPTDEQTLTELSDRSPIVEAILEYRGLRKLLSTYIEPLPSYINARDGRVHTTFNQALTSTGRLSSSSPNLQNIPVRTELGREVRKAFVPGNGGCVMMSADYSQIELRIMAHLSGDTQLREAFCSGVDVHAATAAKIFGKSVADVTADERRVAKTANFGIMYGISSFGLSQRLKCSRSDAKQIIEDYFASFPSIRGFIEKTLADARNNGYVETIFGRRRYISEINSANANLRAIAERNAVNAPIQGSSADIIKLAMIEVDRRLREGGLSARMVLQIHDELVLEVPMSEVDRVREILVSSMENVIKLSVPLTVECNYGNTWLEAH